jgi:hypothetical protein
VIDGGSVDLGRPMTITTSTKIRLALLTTFATAGVVGVVACGSGDDDSSPPGDAGARLDATTVDSGGTVLEAGPADAAPDAADAAPADVLSCAANHYLYCDDFEAYPDSGSIASGTMLGPWMTGIGGKTDAGQTAEMGVDTVKPFSGTYALHVTAPAGESTYGQLKRLQLDGGDIGPDMYGRAMVYFSNAPLPGGSAPLTDSGTYGIPSGVHSWIFASGGHSDELDASVSANIIVGSPTLALNYSPGDDGPSAPKDAGPVVPGTWHCLQWQFDGSGSPPNDVANIWFDGFLEVHTDPTQKYPRGDAQAPLQMAADWTQLTFGFTHYQTTKIPQDVFLDDFAIDDKVVPCPAITP